MLDEKRIMHQKLFSYTWLTILAGFLLGVACVILAAVFITRKGGESGIIGVTVLVASAWVGTLANKVYQQLRDFINRPYLEEMEEEDVEDVDSTTG